MFFDDVFDVFFYGEFENDTVSLHSIKSFRGTKFFLKRRKLEFDIVGLSDYDKTIR